ncbi:NAD(P)/FAD-dependent oxidoreductase [Anaerolinea sp.]|uniref:phytoene desaturase family protein n=1 Tax=Anaerolinea sp. TaxID=1872519 RepID=UPI002ACE2825|nr:NAD(P)/FAD-dependent oxidoreductase [Anaerolinea sp.]
MRIVVIGAGIGGLTTATLLVKAGHTVTVLEAQTYPGGCAGTFFHKGYRFNAGATLAGGFQPGGPHARLAQLLGLSYPTYPISDAGWVVHLPNRKIFQWTDPEQWQEEVQRHFPFSRAFWQLQRFLANQVWDLSSRNAPLPPQSFQEFIGLLKALRPGTITTLPFLFSRVKDVFPSNWTPEFKVFVDAQLLISAQTTSEDASLLYGSAAMDLPRRGIHTVKGGMGTLSEVLVDWIRRNGGEVLFRQEAVRVETNKREVCQVITRKGDAFACDALVANVTPWGWAKLLGDALPVSIKKDLLKTRRMWGAFVLHLGVEADRVNTPITHHQIIGTLDRPLGETNSVFLSLSPLDDPTRAPSGMRAVTISTHTEPLRWFSLSEEDYQKRKEQYTEQCLSLVEREFPGFRSAVRLCLAGSPRTYAYYTHRPWGMVGGFPQTSILQARGPQSGFHNAWLVGDSVFPGQSTAGVTLGAMRVANLIVHSL